LEQEKFLRDYTDEEKGAYISAIASLATADRTASEEESEFLQALADSAELSAEQVERINAAASDTAGHELKSSLDILKNSDLRFSLLTDLVAFAESDQDYAAEEKANIEEMAAYLNISREQSDAIKQFVHKASAAEVTPEQANQPQFLNSLGMDQKFQSAGLNMNSITKGLLAIAGPIILRQLLSRRGMSGGGGGLGGILGGMLGGGGLGGMLGGSGTSGGLGGNMGGGPLGGGMGGGLGSLISILSGGRGIGSTGGLLGRVLKGGF
jgi:uncharacterized tellurite resistance protein B-like protein